LQLIDHDRKVDRNILGRPTKEKNMRDHRLLQQQVKEAWAKLPADVKARLEPQILAAHQQLLSMRTLGVAAAPPAPVHRQLGMVYSMLNDDPEGLLQSAARPAAERMPPQVLSDGEVLWGDVDYDVTDTGWAYVFVALADTWGQTPPFKIPTAAEAVEIGDNATLAILGDWGGANQPALQVAQAAKASSAAYFIHLGDVYYAGTNVSGIVERPYQQTNFLQIWPGPAGKSFALNSNHDMYAHATGYSLTALASPAFSAQKGANCFALYNKSFRIVGLDSAYYAPDDMYDTGRLGGPQAMFLQQQANQAAAAGQNLILLTHHNGLSFDGSTPEPLWQEVADQLAAFSGKSICWYWGHVHIGTVYKPQEVNGITIYPRCCGHSCIPWGVATGLRTSNVVWFEQEVLGPGSNYFVTNGYATLALTGASMKETFYDQSGSAHWSNTWPRPSRPGKASRPPSRRRASSKSRRASPKSRRRASPKR
jgi:hypothetical protein